MKVEIYDYLLTKVMRDKVPEELRKAIGAFLQYYNRQCYHEALGNVTPADVYFGTKDDILARRKEVKRETLQARLKNNRTLRGLDTTSLDA